jgi:outer membrane protein assembly factor BamB
MKIHARFSSYLLLAGCLFVLSASLAFAGDWPEWRGARGDGTSNEKNVPIQWSATENVDWKVPLPEPGNSTPIVWKDRIFLTQPLSKEKRRTLMCLDRSNGKILWHSGPEHTDIDPTHSTNPLCSSSPATDGTRVIAWYGSAGLYCYSMDGVELWKRDLGIQKHIWGYGSSPIIRDSVCYLNFGPGERSFLIAIDCHTGETLWQHHEPINRQGTAEAPFANADYYGSWSTPAFRTMDGSEQLVMSFPFRVCGIDPKNGKELWDCRGTNALIYTSPLVDKDWIVAMGGYNGMAIAIRAEKEARGDITSTHRVWRQAKTKQRIGSGAIHDGHIYIHNDPGIAECIELKSGNVVWEQRLSGAGTQGTNWSSVVIADGKCYTITQGGDCFVFRASPEFQLISKNALGETSNSSIVPSDGQLFIRTHSNLWCIKNK